MVHWYSTTIRKKTKYLVRRKGMEASCSSRQQAGSKGDLCIFPKRNGRLRAFDKVVRMQECLDQFHNSFISDVAMAKMLPHHLIKSS